MVDGRVMLKLIYKDWDGGMDWIGLAQERECECGDELPGCVKCGEFRD